MIHKTLTLGRKLARLWNKKIVVRKVPEIIIQEDFNPFLPPQHWLSDYPKPPKYEEGSDRGATDEGW
tara:strand:+ start:274 stop:474 length:201 start_codon:yes stop_codon:yes gene_type:complete